MSESSGYSRPGLAGSGTIACGLAACATAIAPVLLLARSEASAARAEEKVAEFCDRALGTDPRNAKVTTEIADLADCDLVVEAIVEEVEAKAAQLSALAASCPESDVATTTSSLGVAALGERSQISNRLFGLHVFHPVTRMELVELCLPSELRSGTADRARAFCEGLGKSAVVVPDQAGFIVNRLLFPYLFDAVRTLEGTEMEAAEVDACMTLGAGHPMGPLKLLDFIGIDIAVAIGHSLHAETGEAVHKPPSLLDAMVEAQTLGCKSQAGFYRYE